MAPRGQTLPQATTESAREARKSFYCELCQKGYARMNEFEAHEGSYDHQHRKRLKEMRHLTKDPNAAAKARAAEQRANEEAGGIKPINLSSISSTTNTTSTTANNNSSSTTANAAGVGGKKKPVFKSTLQPHNASILSQHQPQQPPHNATFSSQTQQQPLPQTSLSLPRSTADADEEDEPFDYADDPTQAKANGWWEIRYDPLCRCGERGCRVCDRTPRSEIEKARERRRVAERMVVAGGRERGDVGRGDGRDVVMREF